MARLRQRLSVVAALAIASVALSSCGSGTAVADARTACKSVARAIALQTKSEAVGLSVAQRASLQQDAMSALLKATPAAAAATSSDGSWNALMTAVSEAERVPLENLIPSLARLCAVANSTSPYP